MRSIDIMKEMHSANPKRDQTPTKVTKLENPIGWDQIPDDSLSNRTNDTDADVGWSITADVEGHEG